MHYEVIGKMLLLEKNDDKQQVKSENKMQLKFSETKSSPQTLTVILMLKIARAMYEYEKLQKCT